MKKIIQWRFSGGSRLVVYTCLLSHMNAGMSLVEAIENIRDGYAAQKDWRAEVLNFWLQDVLAGKPLSVALKGWERQDLLVFLSGFERAQRFKEGFAEFLKLVGKQEKMIGDAVSGVAFSTVLVGSLSSFPPSVS